VKISIFMIIFLNVVAFYIELLFSNPYENIFSKNNLL